jgi:adenosylcobyric acid synthase
VDARAGSRRSDRPSRRARRPRARRLRRPADARGEIRDPHGVDGDERGLDLLPLTTRFERDKLLRQTRARFGAVTGAWSPLTGLDFDGYEIRHGRTESEAAIALRNDAGEPIGWQRGSVLGLAAHGLFESAGVMRGLFGATSRTLDDVFEGLADFVERHFEPGALADLARGAAV